MGNNKTCFFVTNRIANCKFVNHCPERKHMACFHPDRNMSKYPVPYGGRGNYAYPQFDDCDCGGYKPDINPIKLLFIKIKKWIAK